MVSSQEVKWELLANIKYSSSTEKPTCEVIKSCVISLSLAHRNDMHLKPWSTKKAGYMYAYDCVLSPHTKKSDILTEGVEDGFDTITEKKKMNFLILKKKTKV